MKIYGDVVSPFVRMCLVTAHEVGLGSKVDISKTVVKPNEVNATLEKLSPIGKIPVLETDHGHAVYDSRVIMEYLAHVGGSSSFIPDDGVKRFRVLTQLALAQGIAEASVGLRYEMFARPETARWPDYAERLAKRILAGLDAVERDWQEAFAPGPATAATVALACTLGYIDFRHAALNWRVGRPKTASFAAAFEQRDSMKAWPIS